MRMFAAATAITLTMAASSLALAQTGPTQPSRDQPSATMPDSSRTGSPSWYTHQTGDMRASKLIGTNVTNAANESIGEINEVVLGKDGKVAAVIIGVGGFLGMGEREVAVNFNALRLSQDSNGKQVIALNTTKDALKAAPAWTWSSDAGRANNPGGSSRVVK